MMKYCRKITNNKISYRFIAILLSFLMAFGVVGCGLVGDKCNETEDLEDNDLVVIGFSQPGAESAWRVALTESVKSAFTEDKGYRLIYKDAQSKQDNQIKDIRTFIQQGVDYIILSPIVETGWDQVLEEAKAAGIPVVVCDRGVKVSNESLYTAYAGSNFRREGQAAVSYIEKVYKASKETIGNDATDQSEANDTKGNALEATEETSTVVEENTQEVTNSELDIENDNKDSFSEVTDNDDKNSDDSTFNIVHIQGTIGSSAQVGRSAELVEAVQAHDDWKIIAQECGEFTKGKAREVMTKILSEIDGKTIDLIYCENDEEAFGAMAALNEAGLTYGVNGDIKIVSFDGTNMALEMCMNGQINFEVECNPLQGEYLFNIIEQLESGTKVPKLAYIEESFFLPENLTPEFIESRQY